MSNQHRTRRGRLSLILIAAVAIAPMAGAYALCGFWRPSSFTNYGQLVPPTPIAESVARKDVSRLLKISRIG